MKRYLTIFGILIQFATAEDLSFVLETTYGGAVAESSPITLNQGDTAKLEYASIETGWNLYMRCNMDGKVFDSRCFKYEASGPSKDINPVTVAGPATIVFGAWGGGIISPPFASPGPAPRALPLQFPKSREANLM